MVTSTGQSRHNYAAMLRGRTLDSVLLIQLKSAIQRELHKAVRAAAHSSHSLPTATAVNQAFGRLFGEHRSAAERRLFLLFAAPLMRHLLLRTVGCIPVRGFDAAALERMLQRLQMLAPHQAQIVDLHYFSGIALEETAVLLGRRRDEIERDLRFVRAWLTHARNRHHTASPSSRD